ncbi:hypothetical protein SAMN06265370_117103 [Puniceibacterium sediminis]|uniref:Uncharacterized protein n=2 Tax=Puniceibacterium sediminis TaxID=1608407 RepID=A0A238YM77_9RHOB|nr:hypothetical protein SAMN06265370_117103 [Puniceibacterium sediminis]
MHFQQLFNDILATGTDKSQSGHFIGSIVNVTRNIATEMGVEAQNSDLPEGKSKRYNLKPSKRSPTL